ncbi:hypothetical protein CHARACLAT_020014 [Characodon lateralis]|uniref:Uncharacterized protein n=1 Tax=Characodon lateralis TaxID=208331 RepID=A0ABU7DCM6_9TELE|nr:hypothetical protein [Characodon lateralis]
MELLIVPNTSSSSIGRSSFSVFRKDFFYGKPHENGLSELLNHVAYKAPQRILPPLWFWAKKKKGWNGISPQSHLA